MLNRLKKNIPFLLLLVPLLSPRAAFAAFCSATSGFQLQSSPKLADIINFFTCFLANAIVPLLFTVAMTIFIWGVVQFIANADNEEKRKKGRTFMIWGIVALFVMVSVWGLVKILTTTFNIEFGLPQLAH